MAVTRPRSFARSLAAGWRQREAFADVEAYCMFIGYPRSGHSVVGALLDAHPDAVIAHELDALRYFRRGFGRRQLYALIVENERAWAAGGSRSRSAGYELSVPNQWQGRFRRLRVIGDKRGGMSTRELADDPRVIDRLERRLGVPVRVIHVMRNPYDNIATMHRRRNTPLKTVVNRHFRSVEANSRLRDWLGDRVLDLRHEDLVSDPRARLAELCRFLGLEPAADYLDDAAGIVFASPRRTRDDAPWTPQLREKVQRKIDKFEFLAGYSFET